MKLLMIATMEPGSKKFVLQAIKPTLDNMHKLVGGILERISICPDVILWCGEEAKIRRQPKCVVLYRADGRPYDVVCGPIFLTGPDKDGKSTDITKEAVEAAMKFMTPA